MKHKARQKLCERRQPRRTVEVEPLPPVLGPQTPDDAAWDEYAARFKAKYGHRPSRDPHAAKLVADAQHAGTPAPEGERVGGRLVVPPVAAPKAWVGKVTEDPYVTEGE